MADGAHNVFIYLVGSVIHGYAVTCLAGNIVSVVYEQDQVVAGIVIAFDNLVIKFLHKGRIS